MRLAIRLLMPKIVTFRLITSFSNHSDKIKQLKNKFSQHRQQISNINKQEWISYFNDGYLYELVRDNYCFADIVDITNSIIFHNCNSKSDLQVLFITYAYNLYYSELKSAKLVFQSIEHSLKHKIASKQFSFQNKEVQLAYLSNIKSLTNRDNNVLEKDLLTLKDTFFRFIALKSGIVNEQGKHKQITDETLSNVIKLVPFIPKDSKDGSNLSQIEYFYNQLIKFECNSLLSKLNNQQNTGEIIKQSTGRFIKLMQVGVTLGQCYNIYISIFQSLPTSFKNQQQFSTYLQIIKYFFSHQLIKRLDYQQFDGYNFQLSTKNKQYRSPQTMRAFQQYVQSLIGLKINNLKMFDPYLFQSVSQVSPTKVYREK